MSDEEEVAHAALTKAEMAAILGSIGGRIGGRSKSKKKVAASRKNAVLATRARYAAAFTEWERRYRSNPDWFVKEAERSGIAVDDYGGMCAVYFSALLAEARK